MYWGMQLHFRESTRILKFPVNTEIAYRDLSKKSSIRSQKIRPGSLGSHPLTPQLFTVPPYIRQAGEVYCKISATKRSALTL